MVPDEGFEPPSADYKSAAKPTQLIRRYLFTLQLGQKSPCPNSVLHSLHVFIQYLSCYLERVRRIELLSSDWKSEVLPLHNTRLGRETGIRTLGTL